MNYFPISLASGKAFCNRKEELQRIYYNIKDASPTLLVSPRRYGKTSLVLKACEDMKKPYSHVDLYKALSEEDIVQFILNGIGQLLGQIENTPEKLMKVATEFFSGFQLKFILESYGLAVEFGRKRRNSVELVLAALERLDKHAQKRKKHVILFLDEFQVLAEIAHNNAMEAAIREAAQKAKQVSYIFSGSNRHLIEAMFNDKKRPFYNLCDTIILGRITKEHYNPYLNRASLERWNKPLPVSVLETILDLVELHPYYVNKLCSLVWHQLELPKESHVVAAWDQYVIESRSGIERELSLLKINQRKLLVYLSNEEGVQEPFSKSYANDWNMSVTSIHRAMEALLQKDYVFINNHGRYCVLDPLIKSVLQKP
jgi:DNA-binding MarR family transcriptional regulator